MFLLLLYVDDENVWNDQVQYFGWQVAFWSMEKDQTKVSITVTDIFKRSLLISYSNLPCKSL
jgi:hypothetical protein